MFSFLAIVVDHVTCMLTYCVIYLLLVTSGSRPKRAHFFDPSLARHKDAQDARVVATKKQRLEERKKKSLFANVSDLKKLSKQEYWEFRSQKFYTLPRDMIRLQHIHNFLCSMLVFTPFA
jgi:hypothetical protein